MLRLPEVLKLIPIGKSSWWDGIKQGIYPKPKRIGKRMSAWRVEDIRALIEQLSNS
ncbi:MAG: AlpA family phage regulatory protein [Alphaproteobacteria bacterium]